MADCLYLNKKSAIDRNTGTDQPPKMNGCFGASILNYRNSSWRMLSCLLYFAAISSGLAAELPAQDKSGSVESTPSVEIQLKLLPSAPERTENSETEKSPESPGKPKADQKDQIDDSPSNQKLKALQISYTPVTDSVPSAESDSVKSSVGINFQPLRKSSEDTAMTRECPGAGPDGDRGGKSLESHPDDIPLEQEEHPFDAPAAVSSNPAHAFQKTSLSKISDQGFDDREYAMHEGIEALLKHFRDNPENVVRRGPWALMHAILPYGVETEVIAGNRRANAIGWLCHNGVSGRQRMFQPTKTGFRPNIGPGVQGHEGQFLAILAQSQVKPDYQLQIANKKYTVMDLVRYEMSTCREKSELTFKLIAFTHYLTPNHSWRDNRGRPWTIEKLVAEELAQPINGAACGGTHRLMGLSCAVSQRRAAGLPITGHYRRAEIFLDDFVAYALSMQNPDGSFSTEWFESRANEPQVERKIQTTGHILEWLVCTVPDDQLQRPEIMLAAEFLIDSLGADPSRDWPIGPRGHSLRALAIYQQRFFSGPSAQARTASQPVLTTPR
jgi:hypothetical protein